MTRRKHWKKWTGYAGGYKPPKPQHFEIDGQPACLCTEYKLAFLAENEKGRKMKHQPHICSSNDSTDVRLLMGIGEEIQELMPDAVVGWVKGLCPHQKSSGNVRSVGGANVTTTTGATTINDTGSWDDFDYEEDENYDPTKPRNLSDKWGTRYGR